MIKVALIGCGRVGWKHAKVLEETQGAKLVAVADILSDRAKHFGDTFGVSSFVTNCEDRRLATMIYDTQPDLIALATPSGYHYVHLMSLMHFDIPVLVEKPAALTLADVDELESDGPAWICEVKQNRYNTAVRHLRQNLPRLGKIRLVSVRVLWSRNPGYYQDWHGSWQMAGGVLANQAIHHIDLLWWLVGDVKRVSAFATYDDYTHVETGLTATLEFANGAIGTIEATTLATKDLEGSLTIVGETGTIELGGFAVNQINAWHFKSESPGDQAVYYHGIETPPDVYGFGHLKLYEDVVRSLETGAKPPIPLWQARKSIEIVHAIYEAMETGRVVQLPGPYESSRLGR